MEPVRPWPIEPRRLSGFLRSGCHFASGRPQAIRVGYAGQSFRLEKTSAAIPPVVAGWLRPSGVPGFPWRRSLPAEHTHGDDLPDSARVALAGPGALALDPLGGFSH